MKQYLLLFLLIILWGYTSLSYSQNSGIPNSNFTITVVYQTPYKPHWGTAKINLSKATTRTTLIETFLSQMTMDEKIAQMTQVRWYDLHRDSLAAKALGSIIYTQGIYIAEKAEDWVKKIHSIQEASLNSRLGIPLLVGTDAIHGQNVFNGATIFPHSIGMAATRNFDLIERAAQISAKETVGTGFNWTFTPCVSLPKHENWGRVYETYSEDVDLTIKATVAAIRGYQQNDLAAPHTVAATAKHYFAEGAVPEGRQGGEVVLTHEEIMETYLAPYKAAVDAGVASVMLGVHSVNGEKMHQNREMIEGYLKDTLGFAGVVVTDWHGATRYAEPIPAVNAGVDIAMQPTDYRYFMQSINSGVANKRIPIERIDDAVRRILGMKYDLGLFSNPFPSTEYSASIGSKEHRAVARTAVRESMVLLKNENGVLPLTSNDTLILVGEHANNSGLMSGGWTIDWPGVTENYNGATNIREALFKQTKKFIYSEKGCMNGMRGNKAVVVVGEKPYAEIYGEPRYADTDFELRITDAHKKYIKGCKDLGKKVITILISGRVLAIENELNMSDAFIAAWLPGSEGDGVVDFLYGRDGFTPKGKVPFAWPRKIDDIPLAKNADHALFKFGYGLQGY